MPYRLPADRIILNPPKFRKVFSTCRTVSLLASPRCGAPAAPHTAFSETFSEAFSELFSEAFSEGFSEAFQSAFRRKVRVGTFLASPPRRDVDAQLGATQRLQQIALTSNCMYLGHSSLHFGHSVGILGAPMPNMHQNANAEGGSSKSSNSHRMLPLGFLRVNGQTCAQNRWLEHPEYQFPRLFTCKWCSTGQARAARVRTLYLKLQAGVPRVQILCKTANPDAYFDEISTRVRTFGVPRPKTANPDAYFGEISNRVRTFSPSRPKTANPDVGHLRVKTR